jgi:hypothetical protein
MYGSHRLLQRGSVDIAAFTQQLLPAMIVAAWGYYVKASGKPVFDANGDFHGYRGTVINCRPILRPERPG